MRVPISPNLKSVAGDLERLIASGKANQAEVERVADTINRVNLDMAKLGKRGQSNEGGSSQSMRSASRSIPACRN